MGGGGSSYTDWKTSELTKLVREQAAESADEFETELASFLAELLSGFERDADLVRERLDQAKKFLQDHTEEAYDLLFGGSVAKHTYVDGLSDVDALLVVNNSEFAKQTPSRILDRLDQILEGKLPDDVGVDHGRMAVSITYPDGLTIQLLPAIRTKTGLKVPSAKHKGWSHIEPEGFRNALTKRNGECGGKLVPTVKLAKAVIATMPEKYRLSGYHVESIAIAAFEGYQGKKTTGTMLPIFFEKAKGIVLSRVRDRTGQSIHVDEYLGADNSELRQNISHLLGGVAKRMRNASSGKSQAQWKDLFDNE